MNKMKFENITACLVAALVVAGTVGFLFFTGCHGAGEKESPRTLPEVNDAGGESWAGGLTDYEVLLLAIAKTESDFNPLAVGDNNDLGVFQITPIFVKEVNRIIGDTVYIHEDAFDMAKSVEMMMMIQEEHNPGHDISRAIAKHNPHGDRIGYARKVRENMKWVRRYEELRSLITEN